MIICWDNLEKLKYNKKTNKWYKNYQAYIYKDHCKVCNEPFLSKLGKEIFCGYICSASRYKMDFKKVKQSFEDKGFKLLDKNYINSITKMKVRCSNGHIYKTTWNMWNRGHKCPYCSGNAKKTYEEVKQSFENEGYILLSTEYKNDCSKLNVQCNKGHKYKVTWNIFQQGHRCPSCSYLDGKSSTEKEILKMIKSLTNENIVENDRTQIINPLTGYKLELDIWIPSLNKAIEFNGKYWHSSEEVKIRDIEKQKQCNKKGIKLMTIIDKDWIKNKEEVIKNITKFLRG